MAVVIFFFLQIDEFHKWENVFVFSVAWLAKIIVIKLTIFND